MVYTPSLDDSFIQHVYLVPHTFLGAEDAVWNKPASPPTELTFWHGRPTVSEGGSSGSGERSDKTSVSRRVPCQDTQLEFCVHIRDSD